MGCHEYYKVGKEVDRCKAKILELEVTVYA